MAICNYKVQLVVPRYFRFKIDRAQRPLMSPPTPLPPCRLFCRAARTGPSDIGQARRRNSSRRYRRRSNRDRHRSKAVCTPAQSGCRDRTFRRGHSRTRKPEAAIAAMPSIPEKIRRAAYARLMDPDVRPPLALPVRQHSCRRWAIGHGPVEIPDRSSTAS